jgi:hypothetical protein
MRTSNCIKIKGILINLFHHGPSKVVTMINGSDNPEFVKTWVNNQEGLRREEGRGEGRGRKDLQNFIPQLLTYQVMMKGVVATAAAQDATQPSHLMVSVSGGPRVDPSFDDMHSRPGRKFEHKLHRNANKFEQVAWRNLEAFVHHRSNAFAKEIIERIGVQLRCNACVQSFLEQLSTKSTMRNEAA